MRGGFNRYERGWGWGGGPGWGWGGGPRYVRRVGYPIMGGGLGFGGLGFGGANYGLGSGLGTGFGGGLLGDLISGGVGYLAGRSMGQQQSGQYQQSNPQYQQYAPTYQQNQQYPVQPQQYQQYQQPAQQYQNPSPQTSTGNVPSNELAQLNLLGQLRQQGTLSEDEFQAEKQKILNG